MSYCIRLDRDYDLSNVDLLVKNQTRLKFYAGVSALLASSRFYNFIILFFGFFGPYFRKKEKLRNAN